MKNLFLAVFSLFSIGAFAQNTPWSTTANIGIGTTSPTAPLEVRKTFSTLVLPNTQSLITASFTGYKSGLPTISQQLNIIQEYAPIGINYSTKIQAYNGSTAKGFISLPTSGTNSSAMMFGHSNSVFMRIKQDGMVSIGTISDTPTGYKLFVEDGILTEKVKVAVEGTANWADYVFADEYKLMPLKDVEEFTKENKHLPNIPSAEEMVTNGLNVAKMDAKLLEKIEELTLYLIEQNKKLESQNTQIELLQKEIEQLKEKKQ